MPTADELIRKALQDRAAIVTENTLRRPELRHDPLRGPHDPLSGPPRRRGSGCRPHLFLAAAATIVTVLAIAVGVYGLRGHAQAPPPLHSGSDHSSPALGTASPLAGTQWRLTEVRSSHLTWPVPKALLVGLALGADGRLNGRDGMLAFTGSYHTAANRITVHDLATPGIPAGQWWPSPRYASNPAEHAMSSILVPAPSHAGSVTSTFGLTTTTLTVTSSRWTLTFRPLSAAATYCLDTPPLRAGTGTSMVPGTPTGVTICPFGRIKTVTDVAELVHAIDALPTSPISKRCEVHGLNADPPGARYELHFHYQSGPDVLVNVWTQCASYGINNVRLQAVSPRTIIRLIKAAISKG